jgi:hypothetical protein
VRLLLLALLVGGCAGQERAACAPEQLVPIETAFIAEATAACDGYEIEDCEAFPAIAEKYRLQRDAWEACQ